MSWLIAFLSLIAGYFLALSVAFWFACKANIEGKKTILILILRNSAESVESIMWDLFRLKSWNYREISFMVIDDRSDDDTLAVLKTLRKNYPFLLISASVGKRFERIKRMQGEKVRVLKVNGPESPRLVRKKIVFLLNQTYHETEFPLRKYS